MGLKSWMRVAPSFWNKSYICGFRPLDIFSLAWNSHRRSIRSCLTVPTFLGKSHNTTIQAQCFVRRQREDTGLISSISKGLSNQSAFSQERDLLDQLENQAPSCLFLEYRSLKKLRTSSSIHCGSSRSVPLILRVEFAWLCGRHSNWVKKLDIVVSFSQPFHPWILFPLDFFWGSNFMESLSELVPLSSRSFDKPFKASLLVNDWILWRMSCFLYETLPKVVLFQTFSQNFRSSSFCCRHKPAQVPRESETHQDLTGLQNCCTRTTFSRIWGRGAVFLTMRIQKERSTIGDSIWEYYCMFNSITLELIELATFCLKLDLPSILHVLKRDVK